VTPFGDGNHIKTLHFYGNDHVTFDWGKGNGPGHTWQIVEGTWRQTIDGAIVQWRYKRMPDFCGTQREMYCKQKLDGGEPDQIVVKDDQLELWGHKNHR
jgi:hypothetical protein